jgi:orotate phosphoribosyltransferase
MTEAEALDLFKKSEAYLEGHFLLTSGLHSPAYVEKFKVLQHPEICDALCAGIAEKFRGEKIDVVVGPAVGGIVLAYGTARALKTRGIFMERENGKLTLRRGFAIAPHERVLIVEDVVTTGTSVFEVLKGLPSELAEGRIVGVGYLVDRSGGKADFKLPRQEPLMRLDLPTYDPADCPLCINGVPLTKRGSREGGPAKKAA